MSTATPQRTAGRAAKRPQSELHSLPASLEYPKRSPFETCHPTASCLSRNHRKNGLPLPSMCPATGVVHTDIVSHGGRSWHALLCRWALGRGSAARDLNPLAGNAPQYEAGNSPPGPSRCRPGQLIFVTARTTPQDASSRVGIRSPSTTNASTPTPPAGGPLVPLRAVQEVLERVRGSGAPGP